MGSFAYNFFLRQMPNAEMHWFRRKIAETPSEITKPVTVETITLTGVDYAGSRVRVAQAESFCFRSNLEHHYVERKEF
jgi:hypothetical protein